MSYADSDPPVGPSQYQYLPGSDAIGIWPTSSMNSYEQHGNEQYDSPSQFEQDQHPQKRARSFEDINNNSGQPTNSRMPMPNNVPVNKGTANIFFKTRMCAKFKSGTCRNGESCNFAHGQQDLRQPPHNWQELVRGEEERPVGNYEDDQRIIHKMKLCKKFYNGEECPYGDRCNFLHEDPSKFREDVGRFRESAAISIGTTGRQPMGLGSSGSFVGDLNRPINNAAGLDASRANIKPVYWKTKLCTKWEITGHCPFGNKCHFAHGPAELQVTGGQSEVEVGNAGSTLTKQQPSVLLANNTSPIQSVNVPAVSVEEGQSKKWLLKLKDPKKLNKIYADWPDDLPLF